MTVFRQHQGFFNGFLAGLRAQGDSQYRRVDRFLFPEAFLDLLTQETQVESYVWIGQRLEEFMEILSRYDCSNMGGGMLWLASSEDASPGPGSELPRIARFLLDRCPERIELTLGNGFGNIPPGYLLLHAFLHGRDPVRPPLPARPEHLEPLLLGASLFFGSYQAEVTKELEPEDFASGRHRAIFVALREQQLAGATEAQARAALEANPETGGPAYLSLLRSVTGGNLFAKDSAGQIAALKSCRGKPS